MNRFLSICSLLLILAGPLHAADTTALEDGIYWFNHRAKGSTGATADSEPISKAIDHLETALDTSADTREAARYLLFSYYVKGTYVPLSADKKQKIFARGKKLGEMMIEAYPESVPILYGYVINLGRWAEVYGILSAAREGVAGTMRDYSRKIADLDPDYEGGAGYRLLGIVYHKSPYIPFLLSWPSNEKALGYLEKARGVAPDDPANNYHYAKVLNALGKTDEALDVLGTVLSTRPRPDKLLEDRRILQQARELRNRIQND